MRNPIEFFRGTPQEKESIRRGREAKIILTEGSYQHNQERRLRRDAESGDTLSHTLTARTRGVVTAVLLVSALVGLGVANRQNIRPFQNPNPAASQEALAKYSADAAANADLIARVDRGMARLNSIVYAGPPNPQQLGSLLSPIVFYNANKDNPDRNQSEVLLDGLKKRGAIAIVQPQVPIPANESYFYISSYRGEGGVHTFPAAFMILTQTMEINQDFDPNNLWDDLIAYHESDHAKQAALFRKSARTAGREAHYLQDLSKLSHNSIVGFYSEADAYLKQIAMLNIISSGQLMADLQNPQFPAAKYAALLHARPNQTGAIESLLMIAQDANKIGVKPDEPNYSFAEALNRSYVNEGFDIYDVKNGKLELVMKHSLKLISVSKRGVEPP